MYSDKKKYKYDGSRTLAVLLALVFVLSLFLFLHFRKSAVPSLELNTKAKHYVVAEVDFFYPDEGSTLILKNEAAASVGAIYRLEEEEIRKEITDFQRLLTHDEHLWQELAKEGFAKDGYESLAIALSLLSNELLQSRFSDLETIQRIHELSPLDLTIQTHPFYVFLPSDNLLGKLPATFFDALAKCFAEEGIATPWANHLLSHFKQVFFRFTEDRRTRSVLQRMITAKIPVQMTHVRAGERLIDQGEEITMRHIAMLDAMKSALANRRRLADPKEVAGSIIFALLFAFLSIYYLSQNHADIFASNRKLALLLTLVLLNMLIASSVELLLQQSQQSVWLDAVRFPLYIPFGALLITCLLGFRLALFAIVFLAALFVLALPVESISFLVVNILCASVIALSSRKVHRRKQLFFAAFKCWLTAIAILVAFYLYEENPFVVSLIYESISTFIFLTCTIILALGLLPFLEFTFQVMTDMTLMEWMDPNNKLLQRLMVEAPGTYQHCILVGNLAEAAAVSIGCGALFCRASALYHDIGKLANPGFFAENSQGVDMHQLLTPLESAKVIIGHVDEGVKLAQKEGLPDSFIDIIREHHGTGLVYYFYHKEKEQKSSANESLSVQESEFRYHGPKPSTKESTLLMIADTVEAAFRSLDNNTSEEVVMRLVDNLIAQKNGDKQFDSSPLSFDELTKVKRVIVKNLLAIRHPRIKYPAHHPGEEG